MTTSGKHGDGAPTAVAHAIIRDLQAKADPEVTAGSQRYFRKHHGLQFMGVRVPTVRATVREHVAPMRSSWTLADALVAARVLGRRRPHELRIAAFVLLGRFKRQFTPSVLTTVDAWLDFGTVTDWATTDGVCLEVVGPLLAMFPELLPEVTEWRRSEQHWRRRTSVVALVGFARRGQHLDLAYRVVTDLLDDHEDLMHKACGWLLREAGKTDRQRLERFLVEHGSRIPRTALRYAIEHFPAGERHRLLAETRGPEHRKAVKRAGRRSKRR